MILLNYNSYFFADVDECEIDGSCMEHSTCGNTFGSYVCTCNEGFMKNGTVCIGKICIFSSESIKSFNGTYPQDWGLFLQ